MRAHSREPLLPVEDRFSSGHPCSRCGHLWPASAQPGVPYGTKDGECFCIDRRYCRARQLTIKLNLERDLFGRNPRKEWFDQMDIRPEDWRSTGWQPEYGEMERVEACLKYHSWCFPVCVEYACMLNADDTNIREDP